MKLKKIEFKSLKLRLVAIFTAIIVVAVFTLGMLFTGIMKKTLMNDSNHDVKNIAESKSETASEIVIGNEKYIHGLASNPILTDKDVSYDEKTKVYKDEAKKSGYLRYAISDTKGNAIMLDGTKKKVDISDRSYFKESMNGEEAVSDVIISSNTGKPVLIFSSPVYKEGKITGVFYGVRDGEFLSDMVSEVKYQETGFSFMVNNEGVAVGDRDRSRVNNSVNWIEASKNEEGLDEYAKFLQEKMFSGKTGSGEFNYMGVDQIVGYSPIEGTNWIIGVGVETNEIKGKINVVREALTVVAVIIGIIGSLLVYFVSGTITNPIIKLTNRIKKLASYDLTESENEEEFNHRQDEIGNIAKALSRMKENFIELIEKASIVTERVASSAEELNSISEQSATASEEVAKAIEEIARGAGDQAKDSENAAHNVNEMGELIEKDSREVMNLNKSIRQIDKDKNEGFEILESLVEKSNENNLATNSVYEITLSNNKSAEEIEKASGMIQNIADQTNLLALNAAIEAARVGENGKGFAVVAEEIRKLAEESNRFTGEINSIINDLKSKSKTAVSEMGKVNELAREQESKVRETEDKFNKIAESIEESEKIIVKLNESSKNITNKKEELVDTIQNLSSIAEENAAGTEEASASMEEQTASIAEIANSTEELASVISELSDVINKFNI